MWENASNVLAALSDSPTVALLVSAGIRLQPGLSDYRALKALFWGLIVYPLSHFYQRPGIRSLSEFLISLRILLFPYRIDVILSESKEILLVYESYYG